MRIISFKQTPFISYEDKNLVQIQIADWDACNPFRVQILINEKEVFSKHYSKESFDVMVPVTEEPKDCLVIVTPFEGIPVYYHYTVALPKQWKVCMLYSAHEDLGYCAYMDKLEHDFYTYLCKAMEMCETLPGFKYLIEHYEWIRGFERYATEEDHARLRKLFEEHKIELNAAQCGVHTHWADGYQLIRAAQFSTQTAVKEWNIPVRTAIYADISGLSLQSVEAYAGQGIRYIGILYNRFRRQNYAGEIPLISRWVAPNKKDSVLLWNVWAYRCPALRFWTDYKRFDFSDFYFDETKSIQTEKAITEMISNLGDVPYSTLPIAYFDDHEVPSHFQHAGCQYMNKKWKYPQFSMEIPSVFMEQIERESGDKLPVLTGDLMDQWADFLSIAPQWSATKREAMRRCTVASLLDTLDAVDKGTPYPNAEYDEIFRLGGVYDEHCWATSSKHPYKMHLYNLHYVKKHSADRAMELVSHRLNEKLKQPDAELGLYNLLPVPWTGGLKLSDAAVVPDGLICQKQRSGNVITAPVSLLPGSVQNYPVRSSAVPTGDRYNPNTFETQFYKVWIDTDTKQIRQIHDKQSGYDMLDPYAQFGFGEYVYTVAADKQSPELGFEPPKENDIWIEEGEVAFVVYKRSYEEQSRADVYSVFTFYRFERNIDVEIRFEHAMGLMGDYYDRYKKNIFIAFPFQMSNPAFYTQLPGGGAYSDEERIQCSPMDFSVAENWASVEGNTRGIALLSRDMPLFHFGGIHLNRFLPRPEYENAHIYVHAASNRCNSLVYETPDDCRAEYSFSVLPYEGSWKNGVQRWSTQRCYPPCIGKARADFQGFKLDTDLRLLAVEPDRECPDAILVTLSEVEGNNRADVKMTLPFAPVKAFYATLNGEVLGDVAISGNELCFDAPALSYTVLKIFGDFRIAKTLESDAEVFDVLAVNVGNHGQIVSFEKAKNLQARSFKVYGDGKLLIEVENIPRLVQRVELPCRPQNIRIEICK